MCFKSAFALQKEMRTLSTPISTQEPCNEQESSVNVADVDDGSGELSVPGHRGGVVVTLEILKRGGGGRNNYSRRDDVS